MQIGYLGVASIWLNPIVASKIDQSKCALVLLDELLVGKSPNLLWLNQNSKVAFDIDPTLKTFLFWLSSLDLIIPTKNTLARFQLQR